MRRSEGEKVGSRNFEVASWIIEVGNRNAAFDKLRRDKVGPVVVRYGRTMPRLKMRKWDYLNAEVGKKKVRR